MYSWEFSAVPQASLKGRRPAGSRPTTDRYLGEGFVRSHTDTLNNEVRRKILRSIRSEVISFLLLNVHVSYCTKVVKAGGEFTIENPAKSILWLDPAVVQLEKTRSLC